MRIVDGICLAALFSLSVLGQQIASTPEFEVADVHVSPRSDWVKNLIHSMQGGFLAGEHYDVSRATMLDLIRLAYNVAPDKIYGGPIWLDYDRFEIRAKAKPGTRPETLRLMLQKLLADRFGLTVKRDERGAPGYQLKRGQGELKLRTEGDAGGFGGCQNSGSTRDGDTRFTNIHCRGMTMSSFAESLRRIASGPLRNLTVADSTGIEGRWNLDLQIPARPGGSADAGVVEALNKLGLKLELGTIAQPVLVVDKVNETPTANQPGIESSLPPVPAPQFEVASIRPCVDSFTGMPRFEPGGRVTAICMSLGDLIRQAFNLRSYVEPIGLPKRLASVTIVAKAPADFSPDPQFNAQAREMLNAMLRALLIDRYKLVTHYENRPVDAQTLVAVKPKLIGADPIARTGCVGQNVVRQGRNGWKHLECQNMTMAQFAEQIQAYDSVEILYPVVNDTRLEGAWDFSLEFDFQSRLMELSPWFRQAGASTDPSGSVTFTTAIEKQLGLKLETHKRSEPVLVIDHIEEKPTTN